MQRVQLRRKQFRLVAAKDENRDVARTDAGFAAPRQSERGIAEQLEHGAGGPAAGTPFRSSAGAGSGARTSGNVMDGSANGSACRWNSVLTSAIMAAAER